MEPIQPAAAQPTVTHERVDTKKMLEWNGRILSIREEIGSLNKKIADNQKHIDEVSSKLGNTEIDDDAAEKFLDKKLSYIDQKTKMLQKIDGLRAEKKELATQLETEKEKKSKEVEEDLVEVEKTLSSEKEKLGENEKILKALEAEASKSEDSKVLREVRTKIKTQKEAINANRKEITEIENRKLKLILESYAFGKNLKARFFDLPYKGNKLRPHSKDVVQDDQNKRQCHCYIDPHYVSKHKNMVYIPIIKKMSKSAKKIESWDSNAKCTTEMTIYSGDYYVKFRAVPGVSVQNCSNLEFSINYKELNIPDPSKVYVCWNYSKVEVPEN